MSQSLTIVLSRARAKVLETKILNLSPSNTIITVFKNILFFCDKLPSTVFDTCLHAQKREISDF